MFLAIHKVFYCVIQHQSWITKGKRHRWRALRSAWKIVLDGQCRIASFNPLTPTLRVSNTATIFESATGHSVCLELNHTKPVFTPTFDAGISSATQYVLEVSSRCSLAQRTEKGQRATCTSHPLPCPQRCSHLQ